MTREHAKSTGRNQPKNQPNNANRKRNQQPTNRKKSSQLTNKQPVKRPQPISTTAVVKDNQEQQRFEEQPAYTTTVTPTPPPKPTYQRELNIKIPANFRKKNPSIDLPDLKALRKEHADRVLEAIKSLEEVLDEFEYPEQELPPSTIKSLVMEIEAFQKQ